MVFNLQVVLWDHAIIYPKPPVFDCFDSRFDCKINHYELELLASVVRDEIKLSHTPFSNCL